MGLDMYLTGELYVSQNLNELPVEAREEEFRLKGKLYDLGYWRKHPNLHGFIVEYFAEGIDDCKPVHLSSEYLEEIILAVRESRLPDTDGFFFGESCKDEAQKAEDIEILSRALAWLKAGGWERSVYYRASW